MSEVEKFKEKYSRLQKKYDLPGIDDIDRDFGLLFVIKDKGAPERTLVAVRKLMADVYNNWAAYVAAFITPNPASIVNYKEQESFDEDDVKKAGIILSKLMFWIRTSNQISLLWKDERQDAEFIKSSYKEFLGLKKDIDFFLTKNIEKWKELKTKAD